MRKSRFSEEQMVRVLRETDAGPVSEVAKRHGLSAQTLHSWRKRFGGLETADVKRLWALEGENARLERLLAERDLKVDALKDNIAKGKF